MSGAFPTLRIGPIAFFLIFPIMGDSIEVSSRDSAFTAMYRALGPRSRSCFRYIFLENLPRFKRDAFISVNLNFSKGSGTVSPSSIDFDNTSGFVPIFRAGPSVASIFFFIEDSLEASSFVLALTALPAVGQRLSKSSHLLFSRAGPGNTA